MSTTVPILGGVGLFLLGMSVMTDGLKAFAGSGLSAILSKAAATPLSSTLWGIFVTLLVQSSSATTMTTIGLVSAGLLTFAQGLGMVFGANIGTTGTAWLVALIGVRIRLTAAALPMIFVGALMKLLGRGRLSASGGALAGFALVLYGLTTLQQGMSGLAERLHPADLPAVFGPGVAWWATVFGVLALVVVGAAMTTVMQSSTAAIAITQSAYFAGAVGFDQACALIIGQNIGSATSSALAAIGASLTAKRLALAHILVNVIGAVIMLVLFPVTIPLLARVTSRVEGVTLLAVYHTAFNVFGVAALLPLIGKFTRFVERILPERRESWLTRCLDPLALKTPLAAEEAVRRTVARSLEAMCRSIDAALTRASPGKSVRSEKGALSVTEASDALIRAQKFISEASGPPESKEDQERLTNTLHALDHASRLAEDASEKDEFRTMPLDPEDLHAAELCAEVMRNAALISNEVGALPDASGQAGLVETLRSKKEVSANAPSTRKAMDQLEQCAKTLTELQQSYRKETLSSVAGGMVNADEAITRVDTIRRLEAVARHAWQSVAYLVDSGDHEMHPAAITP